MYIYIYIYIYTGVLASELVKIGFDIYKEKSEYESLEGGLSSIRSNLLDIFTYPAVRKPDMYHFGRVYI